MWKHLIVLVEKMGNYEKIVKYVQISLFFFGDIFNPSIISNFNYYNILIEYIEPFELMSWSYEFVLGRIFWGL